MEVWDVVKARFHLFDLTGSSFPFYGIDKFLRSPKFLRTNQKVARTSVIGFGLLKYMPTEMSHEASVVYILHQIKNRLPPPSDLECLH